MPSDERTAAILAALAAPRDAYRSALAATLDEVRVYRDARREGAADRHMQLGASLGLVGVAHVDVDRLAAVLSVEAALEPAAQAVMPRALAVLESLAARGDDACALTLVPGENLYEAVSRLFADLGRAIGAGRVVDLARSGRYRPADHDRWLEAFPFGQWSQAERRMAPPVVIELEGSDLRPAGLAEFLDGGAKIVLVVHGETSPAPLVRLITPRTFVAQTADVAVVQRLAAWDGPGIAGIFPAGGARFVHDPGVAGGIGARLTITEVPTLDGRRRAGPFSATQQQDELDQLKALQGAAAADLAVPVAPQPATPADPVDKLAAWLLQQADLSGA
ncbi:MAG: hypothetical protein OER21_02280 [Gemmatimonadota bacterium]|nr:hypothetical protein [Gemmatimonadota bacterium]